MLHFRNLLQPPYEYVRALPQRLLLVQRRPRAPSPSDAAVPVDEEDVADVLVLHPHRFSQVFERLVREQVRRLLLDGDRLAERREEHVDEERLERVLLQVDLSHSTE
jgi:hypothetical protein